MNTASKFRPGQQVTFKNAGRFHVEGRDEGPEEVTIEEVLAVGVYRVRTIDSGLTFTVVERELS